MNHEIEIAVDTVEAEEFAEWLNEQGHTARVGSTTRNYVDGTSTTEPIADEVMHRLWASYCDS